MGREYIEALDKVTATEDWKARTLAALAAQSPTDRRRGRGFGRVLAVAAVCGALLVTAVAVSPGLREALGDALGSFAPYSAQPEGASATDQGIEVRAVSALSDGNVVRYHLSVQDKTGDRLGEHTVIGGIWMERPGAAYGAGSFGNGYLVYYDAKTRTALFELRFTGDGPPARGGTLEVEIGGFQPSAWRETGRVDQGLLTDKTLQTEVLETGETVLIPEQTPAVVEGTDLVRLSSIGFGSDGLLHVQLRLREDLNRQESRLSIKLKSRSTTPEQRDRVNRYYEYGEKENVEAGFEADGYWYIDRTFNVWPSDLDDVILDKVRVVATTGEEVEGTWKLSIPLEDVPHRQIALDQTVGSVRVKSLDLTSLGLSAESDPEGGPGTLNYPAAVILDDGAAVTADMDGVFHTDSYTTNHWSFDEPVDPERVAGVAFGYWYIPIEGDTAGAGYWLEDLPE